MKATLEQAIPPIVTPATKRISIEQRMWWIPKFQWISTPLGNHLYVTAQISQTGGVHNVWLPFETLLLYTNVPTILIPATMIKHSNHHVNTIVRINIVCLLLVRSVCAHGSCEEKASKNSVFGTAAKHLNMSLFG